MMPLKSHQVGDSREFGQPSTSAQCPVIFYDHSEIPDRFHMLGMHNAEEKGENQPAAADNEDIASLLNTMTRADDRDTAERKRREIVATDARLTVSQRATALLAILRDGLGNDPILRNAEQLLGEFYGMAAHAHEAALAVVGMACSTDLAISFRNGMEACAAPTLWVKDVVRDGPGARKAIQDAIVSSGIDPGRGTVYEAYQLLSSLGAHPTSRVLEAYLSTKLQHTGTTVQTFKDLLRRDVTRCYAPEMSAQLRSNATALKMHSLFKRYISTVPKPIFNIGADPEKPDMLGIQVELPDNVPRLFMPRYYVGVRYDDGTRRNFTIESGVDYKVLQDEDDAKSFHIDKRFPCSVDVQAEEPSTRELSEIATFAFRGVEVPMPQPNLVNHGNQLEIQVPRDETREDTFGDKFALTHEIEVDDLDDPNSEPMTFWLPPGQYRTNLGGVDPRAPCRVRVRTHEATTDRSSEWVTIEWHGDQVDGQHDDAPGPQQNHGAPLNRAHRHRRRQHAGGHQQHAGGGHAQHRGGGDRQAAQPRRVDVGYLRNVLNAQRRNGDHLGDEGPPVRRPHRDQRNQGLIVVYY